MRALMKKSAAWTPESLLNESFDLDDSDFIQDPDQRQDVLPQPYRMINKVLNTILDASWDTITERDAGRLADASRFRPPQYECAVHVEDESSCFGKAECLSETPDGVYIVAGLSNGLAAVKADTMLLVDVWTEEEINIASLQVTSLSENRYLIGTVDDMGIGRFFALACDQLFLLTLMNDNDTGNKSIVTKFESSSDGQFLCMFNEKPSIQEGWLEVHKLPKDAWNKDLDALAAKLSSPEKSGSTQQLPKPDDVPIEYAHPSDGAEPQAEEEKEDTTADEPQTQMPVSHRTSHKFAVSTLLFKVMPPAALKGSTYGSVQQASKSLDNNGDVIGTGAHHLISGPHLEQRNAVFKHMHEDQLKYLPEEKENSVLLQPTFHFINHGRIIASENSTTHGQPGSIAIWWQNQTQLLCYSLHKHSRDLERKADVVFPLSTLIVASTISSDGSKVALALDNNNIVIWDMYLGMPKGVMRVSDQGKVTHLTFLDPSVCPQPQRDYPPYPTATSFYVMVNMDDGRAFLVNCAQMADIPTALDFNIVHDDELPTVCCPVDGLPGLLFTCRKNGQVFLHDIHHGKQLCEVILPPEYELASPWQPLICVGGKGRMMYLKGQLKAPELPQVTEETTEEPPETCIQEASSAKLFVFQLRSFPTLDKYRSSDQVSVPFLVHSTVERRVESLFKERLSQQCLRVSRMQQRWGRLKDELKLIQNMREEHKTKNERNVHSASTISKSPLGKFL